MDNNCKLLFVDDEPNVLRALQRVFLDDDFEIITAESAEEGLSILEENPDVWVVVSDYRMPGLNGVDFLKAVNQKFPETVRIVLSGYADTAAVVAAINEGQIFRFVPKPWDDEELRDTINTAIKLFEQHNKSQFLISEYHEYSSKLKQRSKELEHKIIHQSAELTLNSKALQHTTYILSELPVGVIIIIVDDTLVELNSVAKSILAREQVQQELSLLGEKASEVLPKELYEFFQATASSNKVTGKQMVINGLTIAARGICITEDGQSATILTLTPLSYLEEAGNA